MEWFPATGRDLRSCCRSWLPEQGRRVQVQGHLTLRMVSRKKSDKQSVEQTALKVRKAKEGPKVRCPGPGLSLPLYFFSASFYSAFPSLLHGSLTARAPFCCTCFAEVNVDGEMRRSIRFPYFHLFFVELKVSCLATRHCGNAGSAAIVYISSFVCWQHTSLSRSSLSVSRYTDMYDNVCLFLFGEHGECVHFNDSG